MGAADSNPLARPRTPVRMYWAFGTDNRIEPRLTIKHDGIREQIFDTHDVDSLSELEAHAGPAGRNKDEIRFGVVAGHADTATYHTDVDLLARVDGIDRDLAAGLIDEAGDLPSLCERQRRSGDYFLVEFLYDAEVQGREWADRLDAFHSELSRDEFEQRLKDADVWVEPDTAAQTV